MDTINVDAGEVRGKNNRFWASLCNPSIDTGGKKLYEALADLNMGTYRCDLWRAGGLFRVSSRDAVWTQCVCGGGRGHLSRRVRAVAP